MPPRAALLLCALLLSLPAIAGTVRVAEVLDGDTLRLDDGRVLRLSGIEAPKPSADGRRTLADAATKTLRDLAEGRALDLAVDVPEDRHGRVLARARRDDGLWLQDELLRRGLARVHTRPDARARAAEMLAAEAEARAAGLGLWATRAYAVRPADAQALARDIDSFQVIEGRVVHASKRRDELFLDFGEDWRSDVTVRLDREAQRLFQRSGLDPLALEGAVIRVRGWVVRRNGPMIDATHPEQIERLAPGGKAVGKD